MFAFHKPRVYRSTEGCCICRAKSSSSRFTDSKKYEEDSMKCFDLKQPRYGEICNACVLLVKRFKRLPMGSNRHWGHVVDARAGPGMKSMTKFKKQKDDESCSATTTHTTKSLISEKFTKIFKKKKKLIKDNKNDRKDVGGGGGGKRNKSISSSSATWYTQSLPPTPDSLDSDYEETPAVAATPVVQYQTLTRSSSYRARSKSNNVHKGRNDSDRVLVRGVGGARNKMLKLRLGSNRRKFLPPQKNRTFLDDNVPFFDLKEWSLRHSCCGFVYENKELNATILDIDNYVPCQEHSCRKIAKAFTAAQKVNTNSKMLNQNTNQPVTATITLATIKTNNSTYPTINNQGKTNSTPALKKHHLFFKRQSESFPHGDISTMNNPLPPPALPPPPPQNSQSVLTGTISATVNVTTQTPNPKTDFPQNCKISSTTATLKNDMISSLNGSHCSRPYLIPTPLMSSGSSNHHGIGGATTLGNKTNSFLHKIKSDAGKIVKNSVDKISSLRLKSSELNEMKQQNLIKTVEKSYGLSKVVVGPPSSQISSNNIVNSISSKSMLSASVVMRNAVVNHTSLSSLSSTAGTKFSDNSSDSGFDENTQDRKSVSPLQEDTERRIRTPPVQTMFLANGVQIQGTQSDLIRAGNEITTKILEARKQKHRQQHNQIIIQQQPLQQHQMNRSNNNITSTAINMSQITTGGSQKLRQHYPISNHPHYHHQQHLAEVGTTITATSSIAPNLIAITPQLSHPSSSASLINHKKISTANTILTTATSSINNNNNSNVSSLNQKIILVKTKYNSANNNSNNTINNHTNMYKN